MPSGVSLAQAVVIGGKVYVGGGGKYNVLVYAIQKHQWKEIETPVMWFGMAVVNDRLIITGRENDDCSTVDKVWELDSSSHTWRQPFPEMPTGRWGPSAIGYKRWVFVVGGHGVRCVEVLDTKSKHWYTAAPLPFDADRPSLTLIQDTLYAVCECSAVCASLLKLVSGAMSQSPAHDAKIVPEPTEWQRLPDTPTKAPTTTTLNGSLIAMGGHPLSSTIAMYLPQTEQWLNVAELPTPRSYCTCALLPETEELIVIGGWDKKDYIKAIDLCTF